MIVLRVDEANVVNNEPGGSGLVLCEEVDALAAVSAHRALDLNHRVVIIRRGCSRAQIRISISGAQIEARGRRAVARAQELELRRIVGQRKALRCGNA